MSTSIKQMSDHLQYLLGRWMNDMRDAYKDIGEKLEGEVKQTAERLIVKYPHRRSSIVSESGNQIHGIKSHISHFYDLSVARESSFAKEIDSHLFWMDMLVWLESSDGSDLSWHECSKALILEIIAEMTAFKIEYDRRRESIVSARQPSDCMDLESAVESYELLVSRIGSARVQTNAL